MSSPMRGLGSGVFEIALPFRGDALYHWLVAPNNEYRLKSKAWNIRLFILNRGISRASAGHRRRQ